MSDKNKAILFTRSEGGLKVPCTFDVFKDELDNYTKVEKKEVYSKTFKMKIISRVVKIGKAYVHALFFQDGEVYDVRETGFVLRKHTANITL